jgi:ABC-type spermidine/putrescine transport system permease subunit II
VKPEINAISTIMLAFVAIVVVTASLLTKRYAAEEKGEAAGVPL